MVKLPDNYNPTGTNENLEYKDFFYEGTNPLMLFKIMITLNNLSRFHLETLNFLIEKYHIDMMI